MVREEPATGVGEGGEEGGCRGEGWPFIVRDWWWGNGRERWRILVLGGGGDGWMSVSCVCD